MTFSKTIAAAAAAAFFAGSAMAGGFATSIQEPDIVVVTPDAPGSLPGWVIPAIIVAALIGVASSGSDDDDGTLSSGDDSLNPV